MPNKNTSKSSRVNSLVSADAKEALIEISQRHYNGNQTAALNGLLLNASMTQLGEPIEFQTTYNGVRCRAFALPEVALGGDGWANLRVDGGIIHRRQCNGAWEEPEPIDPNYRPEDDDRF